MHRLLRISTAVKEAIREMRPIVALQSTIIAHGIPSPFNYECAISLQNLVVQNGATPATIAIFDGYIHVGLTAPQLKQLAQMPCVKVSRRDLPYVLQSRQRGATTVAATMIIAQMAGIQIFVTGGIGGVHKGAEETMDISADLRELGRTPVSVVCAGVKSILSIPKTLQYLETEGVPVITFKSQFFPGFFAAKSQCKSPLTLYSTEQIAEVIQMRRELQMNTGILIAVPNNHSFQGEQIEQAIQIALKEVSDLGVKHNKITPFLLKRVNQITQGKSLKANIALINHNVVIGTEIARFHNKLAIQAKYVNKRNEQFYQMAVNTLKSDQNEYLKNQESQKKKRKNKGILGNEDKIEETAEISMVRQKQQMSEVKELKNRKKMPIVVIGCSAIDFQHRSVSGYQFEAYRSCQTECKISFGGVARNIAEVCARLWLSPTLVTALGTDGAEIAKHIRSLGINLKYVTGPFVTGRHISAMDGNNDEYLGMSEMSVNSLLTFDSLYEKHFKHVPIHRGFVIVDANVGNEDQAEFIKILRYLKYQGYTVIFQCKGQKSIKIVQQFAYRFVDLIRMNKTQFDLIVKEKKGSTEWIKQIGEEKAGLNSDGRQDKQEIQVPKVIVTNGKENVRYFDGGRMQEVSVLEVDSFEKSTGAGDAFTGAFVSCLAYGKTVEEALRWGIIASKITIQNPTQTTHFSDALSLPRLIALRNSLTPHSQSLF